MSRSNKPQSNIKSQVSIDFIIVTSAMMLVFLFLLTVIDHRSTELSGITTRLSAKEVADNLAWNINEAFISGYGSKKSIFVPESLYDQTNFNLTVIPRARLVQITWGTGTQQYTSPLVTSNITGNLTLVQGMLNITNDEGTIKIEE